MSESRVYCSEEIIRFFLNLNRNTLFKYPAHSAVSLILYNLLIFLYTGFSLSILYAERLSLDLYILYIPFDVAAKIILSVGFPEIQ